MFRMRLVPPVWFLLGLGAEVALDRYAPVAQLVQAPWHWLGLLLGLPAGGLAVSGARALARRGTTIHPFGQPTALVTDGPYRYSRNPLYLSLACLLGGVAIFLGSLTPFAVLPAFVWLISALFICPEEERLTAAFGNGFLEYCRRVRRWL